jgi:hypothetical protein
MGPSSGSKYEYIYGHWTLNMDPYLVQCVILYNRDCALSYNVLKLYLGYIKTYILYIDSFKLKVLKVLKAIMSSFKVKMPNIVWSYVVKL